MGAHVWHLSRPDMDPHTGDASLAQPIITTRSLTKSFGDQQTQVLRDIDLDIRTGEAVAIVGSNGAGKSTLLKSVVGLIPLTSGEIEIFGERFSRRPSGPQTKRLRKSIGFVFQFHGLVARLSALSNVVQGAIGQGYGARAWHQAIAPQHLRADAVAALARVGLADRTHDRAEALSGGQSQRVAIARAIVHKPRLLIADEPVASLDPSAGVDVMRLFREIAGGDITLVYTTHNMEHALGFSDRIVAMRNGQIAFDRPTAEVTAEDLGAIYG